MKIYTKTGDSGHTQVYLNDFQKRSKADPLLEVYGTLDELNAHLGMAQAMFKQHQDTSVGNPNTELTLGTIQHDLFQLGFVLSASAQIESSQIIKLEQQIDAWTAQLPAQTQFILPGGCLLAAQLHVCRTIARRAERNIVTLAQEHDVPELVLQYINRLSDYLFVAARVANQLAQTPDVNVSLG
jgi:cob(I)alamin adenosyltransferase